MPLSSMSQLQAQGSWQEELRMKVLKRPSALYVGFDLMATVKIKV